MKKKILNILKGNAKKKWYCGNIKDYIKAESGSEVAKALKDMIKGELLQYGMNGNFKLNRVV